MTGKMVAAVLFCSFVLLVFVAGCDEYGKKCDGFFDYTTCNSTGAVACYPSYATDAGFVCYRSAGSLDAGVSCTSHSECLPSMACVSNICYQGCDDAHTCSAAGQTCFDLAGYGWTVCTAQASDGGFTDGGIYHVSTPQFNPPPGTYNTSQNVVISVAQPAGAKIHYTTDGTVPNDSSPVYAPPISIGSGTTNLKAYAVAPGWKDSALQEGAYTINGGQVATPTFSIGGGTFATAQDVTVSTSTSGATLRCTTDGSEPTCSSDVCASSVHIATTTILKAVGCKTGMDISEVASAAYTITSVATPTFSPIAGTYTSAQNVVVSTVTPGATLHCTTYGMDPTCAHAVCASPMNIATTTTLKAIGCKDGMTSSSIASGVYTITGKVADPILDPAPPGPGVEFDLNILSYVSGATLHCTTNGTEPTCSSGACTSPVHISVTTTFKVIACKTDWLPSNVVSGTYVIAK